MSKHAGKSDAQIVAEFITGYWPGLEDGIDWNSPESSPVLAAAQRINAGATPDALHRVATITVHLAGLSLKEKRELDERGIVRDALRQYAAERGD